MTHEHAKATTQAGWFLNLQITNGNKNSPGQLELAFCFDVLNELVNNARIKFPRPDGTVAALAEEVGELAKAMLDESPERVYCEAVQVAVVALRVALEGDPSLDRSRSGRGQVGAEAWPAFNG